AKPTPELLRRYFLGELSEAERERLEEACLGDEAVFAEALAVEEALVEDYLAGRGSERERRRFEEHALASPRQRLALDVTDARARAAARRQAAAPAPHPLPDRSLRRGLLAAGVAAGALAGLWSLNRATLHPQGVQPPRAQASSSLPGPEAPAREAPP